MNGRNQAYRLAAITVFIPTLAWYFACFFFGSNGSSQTFIMVIGITLFFALSALLFALGESIKMALVSLFLALAGVLILFLVVGFVNSLQGIY